MRKVVYIFLFFLTCSLANGQVLTDTQFFKAVNLDFPGLESVKLSVERRNYSDAKRFFVAYIKHRKTPVWLFDWRLPLSEKRNTAVNIHEADRYAKNELVSCGIWYQFGNNVDWQLNPTKNNYKEWTWQLNRHYGWITLGQAYWKTGDERYAKSFVSQLNSWLVQCKCPKDDGNYENSPWRTLDAGIRMRYTWPNAFYYFLSSPSFDDETAFRMVKSFYEHALFLYDHSISKQRLSHEMNGLYTIGVLFPEFCDAEKWRALAVDQLYAEEVDQFYPDGAQKELSPGYHSTNLSCIVTVYRLAQLNHYSLPEGYVPRLESIYAYYELLRMPNGLLPAINDSKWVDSQGELQRASEYFENRKDFMYSSSQGAKGKNPSFTSVWMPWAGWYVTRSGWSTNDFYSFFEVGPYGTGHQHEDKLSFILYAYGSLLITECGNYSYDNSQFRSYAVSARVHNVARIDGQDQNRFAVRNNKGVSFSSSPLENRWISNGRYDFCEGYYQEGYGSNSDSTVSHHRCLKFVKKKFWLVTDEFIPTDNSEHYYDIWFHFNTDKYRLDKRTNVVYSDNTSEANIAIVHLGQNTDVSVVVGQASPEVQGWVSDVTSDGGYICRPVATPVFHNKGTGNVKDVFVFIPFPKGEVLTVSRVKKISSLKYRIYFEGKRSITVKL